MFELRLRHNKSYQFQAVCLMQLLALDALKSQSTSCMILSLCFAAPVHLMITVPSSDSHCPDYLLQQLNICASFATFSVDKFKTGQFS